MAATMTSRSAAVLAAKSILQILHLYHRDFHKLFCQKVLRANGGFDPKYKLGTSLTTLLKLDNSMKSRLFICRL